MTRCRTLPSVVVCSFFWLLLLQPCAAQNTFLRGDVDADGRLEPLQDALHLLSYEFAGGDEPVCDDAADVDDDGVLSTLVDVLYLLDWAFAAGPAIPAPSESCADDPTDDDLACATSECPVSCTEDACYVVVSPQEILDLPDEGSAWDNLVDYADLALGDIDLCSNNVPHNVRLLARAMVAVREEDEDAIADVREELMAVVDFEFPSSCRSLAPSRYIGTYVVVAQLVGFDDTVDELDFTEWLDDVRTMDLSGRTIVSTHEDRPNNWGTHAGFTRMAIAIYLGDDDDLEAAADVFRGYLGERDVYDDFSFGSLCYQSDTDTPVGINPVGAVLEIDGVERSVDGVLTEEMRRAGCPPEYPFPQENYCWEALQGAVMQAWVLDRQGYDVLDWGDEALLRAVTWLHDEADFPAGGDDEWQAQVWNHFYDEDFPTDDEPRAGKNFGFLDWILDE